MTSNRPPCPCGNPAAEWRSIGKDTRREYLCDRCYKKGIKS